MAKVGTINIEVNMILPNTHSEAYEQAEIECGLPCVYISSKTINGAIIPVIAETGQPIGGITMIKREQSLNCRSEITIQAFEHKLSTPGGAKSLQPDDL